MLGFFSGTIFGIFPFLFMGPCQELDTFDWIGLLHSRISFRVLGFTQFLDFGVLIEVCSLSLYGADFPDQSLYVFITW